MSAEDINGPARAFDTDVLVVGTGPMGATTALALARLGTRVVAINRFNWTADTPRAHITNQRAAEVLRDLGVEDEARQQATPWEWMGDTLFTTSLAGDEIARLRTWGTGDERIGDYLQASPCGMMDLPQNRMEPLLVTHAAAQGAEFRFNTEYLGHEQDASGVTVRLRDRRQDREYTMRARSSRGRGGLPAGGSTRPAASPICHRSTCCRRCASSPGCRTWRSRSTRRRSGT